MGSHFHSHQAPRHRAEHLHDGLLACAYAAFPYHLSVALQHAITAGLVSQVHADRKAFFASFSAPPPTLLTNVILLHGRFSFCTSSASIREHIASRRGRPSHSISVAGRVLTEPRRPRSGFCHRLR